MSQNIFPISIIHMKQVANLLVKSLTSKNTILGVTSSVMGSAPEIKIVDISSKELTVPE